MFNEFFNDGGSILAVFLLIYSGTVMRETLFLRARHVFGAPLILQNKVAEYMGLSGIPALIWPAIYIGIYSGWIAGIIAFLGLQLGGFGAAILGIRGNFIGHHYIAACILMPIGYILSISTLIKG